MRREADRPLCSASSRIERRCVGCGPNGVSEEKERSVKPCKRGLIDGLCFCGDDDLVDGFLDGLDHLKRGLLADGFAVTDALNVCREDTKQELAGLAQIQRLNRLFPVRPSLLMGGLAPILPWGRCQL